MRFSGLCLQALPLGKREPIILSVGQFRPEKDHPLQIRAFSKLLKSGPWCVPARHIVKNCDARDPPDSGPSARQKAEEVMDTVWCRWVQARQAGLAWELPRAGG